MQIKNLSMSFGMQELFKDVNLYIKENEKVGIVGVNGSGKSTFLKIILGDIAPTQGKITFESKKRIGFLPQIITDEIEDADITVMEFLMQARPIDELNKKLESLYLELSNTKDLKKLNLIYKKINKVHYELEYFDSYNAESTLLKIIDGMNISSSLLDSKIKNISGGQKSKVAFARLLYSNPEILLLDEPTNHLDNNTKDYVTNYIKNYKGSVFVISHDTSFLNEITTKILFLDKRKKTFEMYDGNYDNFLRLKKIKEEILIRQAKIEQKEEDKLRAIIDKYSNSSGKRKKMAQDREKKLDKLLKNKIDIAPNLKDAKININMNKEGNKIPLRVNNLCFKYNKNETKNIIDNLSFELSKGEKFLIVGENGVGKSTLLKLIIGYLKPDLGSIEIGNKMDIGYYAQEHELLYEDKTILENFSDLNIGEKDLRNTLGRFLFYGDDVFKKISVLSPGERSRVALAKLSLIGSNFLILDEPTNHLDTKTQSIIANTFKNFKGTMLVVSHNLEFVDNLKIDRILMLPSGKIVYYDKSIVEHFEILNSKN